MRTVEKERKRGRREVEGGWQWARRKPKSVERMEPCKVATSMSSRKATAIAKEVALTM